MRNKYLFATSAAVTNGGGIASYAQEFISQLGNPDWKVDLLTDENINSANGFCSVYSTALHNIYAADYAKSIISLINTSGYDFIINSSSILISVISPYLNIPIISISHFVNGKLAIIAGYNYKYLSNIVSLSNYGKRFIDNYFNIKDNDKTKVVYNCVNTHDSRYDDKKCLSVLPIIVYPGGTSIMKSFDIVIKTVDLLLKTSLDFRFYWVGQTTLPGGRLSIPRSLNNILPKDPRLIITGLLSRKEAVDVISSANIFLLPSRGEGCPISLLEAMRTGCVPIVSDAHHGSLELLELGNLGLICKNNSSEDLYEKIKEVIVNHADYIKQYPKSVDFVVSKLSPEKWKSDMMEIINMSIFHNKSVKRFQKSKYLFDVVSLKLLIYWESVKTKCRSLVVTLKLDVNYIFKKR
jgi:glycosyltransferase involved in cell wall biosynthesis